MEKRAKNFINRVGQKYGKLLVLELDRVENRETFWKCICNCGKTVVKRGANLIQGGTTSCGCLKFKYLEEGESGFNKVYVDYKIGAKKRNLDFNLTKEQFKEINSKNCHYCKIEPLQSKTTGNTKCSNEAKDYGNYTYNGIDRKDNNLGYTLENSLPCCLICNRAKGNMSYQEFIDYIGRFKDV